jgi:hypothetical protein
MFPQSPRRANAQPAVLHLTHELAEWLGDAPDGSAQYARAPVAGETAAHTAAAALAARAAAGAPRQKCLLALGGRLVDHRVIELPELSRGDLRSVLARKAAHALECGLEDALYGALPLGTNSEAGGDAAPTRKWLVMSVRKSLLRPIEAECRRRGLAVTRLVSAPLARLCEAQRLRGSTDPACTVVDIDLDAVVVSLLQGVALQHQNRIQGGFAAVPTMALTLVQELKSFDAFWRRSSRGSGVSQVVVIGLDLERTRLFATAVSAALPDATVTCAPTEAPDEQRAVAHRIAALSACRTSGPLALEIPLARPPRPATIATVGGAAMLVASLAAVTVKRSLDEELGRLEDQRLALDQRTARLESLCAENREAERLVADLTLEVERQVEALTLGVPVARSLEALTNAIESRGSIRTLSLELFDGTGEVRFGGVAPSNPVDSIEALLEIEHALEASPLLEGVRIEPPPYRRSETDQGQEFHGSAQWETP